PAEQQVERMRQHRLPGPRLPRQHVQPRSQAQLRALDQQEILDAKLFEHPRISSSACRRIARARSISRRPLTGPDRGGARVDVASWEEGCIMPVGSREGQGTSAYTRRTQGMAATDHHQRAEPQPSGEPAWMSAAALQDRLEEEINRARRHDTSLSCLLVRIDRVEEMQSEQVSELPAQALTYASGALRAEPRSFVRNGRLSDTELL